MVNQDHDLRRMHGGRPLSGDSQIAAKAYEEEFPEERLRKYHELFSRLPYYQVDPFRKRDDGLFFFIDVDWLPPDESGESNGVEKGYVYSHVDPGSLVESLDGLGFDDKGCPYKSIFYKRIEKHWYLYFESYWTHGE